MKKKGWIVLICIIAVVLIGVFGFIGIRNNLVTLHEEVLMQQSQVETTLERRGNLIPNLVETVKGYAAHEESIFTEIAEARAGLLGSIESGDVEAMGESNQALDSALGRLLAISEAYPDLKASEQFIALQDELAGSENRIAVARQHYNEKVAEFNKATRRFPSSFVANMLGLEPMPYFEASEGAAETPNVDFSQ